MKGKRRRKPQKAAFSAKKIIVPAVLFGVILVSGFYFFHTVYAAGEQRAAPVLMAIDPNIGVKTYVTEFFTDNDAEEMLPIIKCESNFKHYGEDGEVLKNFAGSNAIGVAQIMSSVHPDPKILKRYNRRNNTDLTEADFDLTTLEGNLGYALVLYTIRGVRDWECAKKVRFW